MNSMMGGEMMSPLMGGEMMSPMMGGEMMGGDVMAVDMAAVAKKIEELESLLTEEIALMSKSPDWNDKAKAEFEKVKKLLAGLKVQKNMEELLEQYAKIMQRGRDAYYQMMPADLAQLFMEGQKDFEALLESMSKEAWLA